MSTTEHEGGPAAVPLPELLRSIPREARLKIEDDWKSSTMWPVGSLANRAADEIERLRSVIQNALTLLVNPHDGGQYEDGEVPVVDLLRTALRFSE